MCLCGNIGLLKRVVNILHLLQDLIESYTKSLRYREIYNYIADGRLPGNVITQKKMKVKQLTT